MGRLVGCAALVTFFVAVVSLSSYEVRAQRRRHFPDFATNDLLRQARATQLTDDHRPFVAPPPPPPRALRSVQSGGQPQQRRLRPLQSPGAQRPRIAQPQLPKSYNENPSTMYDPNGNRMKKAVLPAVIQAKKPYYGTPPPPTPVLKKRVVKAPRPTSLPYQAPTTERQVPSASQDRPVYRQPERPERPAYQYQRPEPSQERTPASYEYPREEEPQQQTYKRAVEKVSNDLDESQYLEAREPEEERYTARSGPAFAPSNVQPSYAESPYGYQPPPEQRAIQEAVLVGANAYHAQDPEVYQNEDRLSFHIQGHDGPHSYRYGYDTGHGYNRQFRYEERDGKGYLKGRYGFFDKYGKLQVTNYSADPYEGFHAEGAAVPKYPH